MELVGGRFGLKYFPRDPAMRAKTTGSWKDIGPWYNGSVVPGELPLPPSNKK